MKKRIIRGLFIIFGLLIPLNIFAQTGSVSITCDNLIFNSGDTASCIASISADFNSDTVTLRLSLSGAELLSANAASGWTKQGGSGNNIMLYKEGGATGEIAIFSIKLTGDTASVGISADIASTIDDCQVSPTGNTVSFRKADSNNYLSSLSVTGFTIKFNKDTLEYNLGETDLDSIIINAAAESDNSSITGAGTSLLLKYGLNTFNVVCKAENGSTKTYVIKVTRKDNRSSNANLSSLQVNGKSIDGFKSDTYSYTIKDYSDDQIKIDATTQDNKSKVTQGTGTFNVNTGDNSFKVVVTAENGTTKTYTIKVTKPVSQDELKLKSLTIENKDKNYTHGFKISDNTNTYKVDVDLSIDKINILAELKKGNGTIEGLGEKELKEGKNQFKLVIKAGEETREITLIINRVDPNSMTMEDYISKITINGNDIKFSISKNKYSIDVDNSVTKIEFNYPDNDNFKFESSGGDNLVVGENTIKFKVIGKDNESKTFELIVNRLEEKSKLDELKLCLIILCILEFIVIVILTIVILNRRKRIETI